MLRSSLCLTNLFAATAPQASNLVVCANMVGIRLRHGSYSLCAVSVPQRHGGCLQCKPCTRTHASTAACSSLPCSSAAGSRCLAGNPASAWRHVLAAWGVHLSAHAALTRWGLRRCLSTRMGARSAAGLVAGARARPACDASRRPPQQAVPQQP